MKKLFALFIASFMSFSVQAMSSEQGHLVQLKTSDDQMVLLSQNEAQQSSTLADLIKDKEAEPGEPLPIGNVTLEEFKNVTPFLKIAAEKVDADKTFKKDGQTVTQKLGEYYNTLQLSDNERTSLHGLIYYLDVGKMLDILPIPVQTNDETIFWVEKSIINQSRVLRLNCKDCAGFDPIFLPNVSSHTLACLLSLIKDRDIRHYDADQLRAMHEAVDYLAIQSLTDVFNAAKIQTNDGTIFVVEKSIIAQSGVLSNNVQDLPEGYGAIVLQNLDAKSFECLVDVLKKKISFEDLSIEQMGAVYAAADYLDVPAIMEQFSEIDFFLSRKLGNVLDLKFSQCGQYLAVRYKGAKGELIRTDSWKVIQSFTNVSYDGFIFSPNGEHLVVRYMDMGKYGPRQLICTDSGEVIKIFDNVRKCKFSPNEEHLVVLYKDTSQLIRTDSGAVIKSFTDVSFLFSAEGKHLSIRYLDPNLTGQVIRLDSLRDYLPAEAALIIKAFAASKKNATVTLSPAEYETYQSLDEQTKNKIEEYFIFP